MSDNPTEPSASTQRTSTRLDNKALSDLYPKAKTYDEQLADNAARQKRIIARQPRHLALVTSTRLFAVVGLGTLTLSLAPVIVLSNVMAGVFILAFLVIVWMGIVKWQTDEVAAVVYSKGLDYGGFLTIYLFAFVPVVAVALYAINSNTNGVTLVLLYLGLFAVHFIAIRWLLEYIDRRYSRDD